MVASAPIRKGEWVGYYVGEVATPEQATARFASVWCCDWVRTYYALAHAPPSPPRSQYVEQHARHLCMLRIDGHVCVCDWV